MKALVEEESSISFKISRKKGDNPLKPKAASQADLEETPEAHNIDCWVKSRLPPSVWFRCGGPFEFILSEL